MSSVRRSPLIAETRGGREPNSCTVFTADWGNSFRANAARWLWKFRGRRAACLEIGVFEGRSGCWMLEHILTHPQSRYVGIDSWRGSARVETAYRRARRNLAPYANQVELIRGRAQNVLRGEQRLGKFDIAYLDADHRAPAVLEISRLLWPRVVPDGVVIWDDLTWPNGEVTRGLEQFLREIDGCYTILFRNHQLGVRKLDC